MWGRAACSGYANDTLKCRGLQLGSAAVVHKYLYRPRLVSRKLADELLREASAVSGVPARRRWLLTDVGRRRRKRIVHEPTKRLPFEAVAGLPLESVAGRFVPIAPHLVIVGTSLVWIGRAAFVESVIARLPRGWTTGGSKAWQRIFQGVH